MIELKSKLFINSDFIVSFAPFIEKMAKNIAT